MLKIWIYLSTVDKYQLIFESKSKMSTIIQNAVIGFNVFSLYT